jgi:hypothetical protein
MNQLNSLQLLLLKTSTAKDIDVFLLLLGSHLNTSVLHFPRTTTKLHTPKKMGMRHQHTLWHDKP